MDITIIGKEEESHEEKEGRNNSCKKTGDVCRKFLSKFGGGIEINGKGTWIGVKRVVLWDNGNGLYMAIIKDVMTIAITEI